MADLPDIASDKSGTWNRNRTDRKFLYNKKAFKSIIMKADKHGQAAGRTMISYHKPAGCVALTITGVQNMKNKEFWKGAVAGALVVTVHRYRCLCGSRSCSRRNSYLVIASVHQSWHILKSMIDQILSGR